MFDDLKLSQAARAAVRAAVTRHPRWKLWSRDAGVTSANLSASDLLRRCAAWSIDAREIAAQADAQFTAAPAPVRSLSGMIADDPFQPVQPVQPVSQAVQEAQEADWMRERADAATAAEQAPKPEPVASTVAAQPDMAALINAMATLFGPIVDQKVAKALETLPSRETVHIIRHTGSLASNRPDVRIDGHVHPQFGLLLKLLSAKDPAGRTPNLWIAGPTGSGKTHAVEQAAQAMGRDFFFNGALGMAHELLGFVDAAGNYHTTPFRQAFEHGGVYLFDEVDASDNAALLPLNAALSNGVAAFPDQTLPVKRHKDFICVAAANTFGQGATAEFIGRAKLDAAFLSRFPGKLFWIYDTLLEQQIAGDLEWTKRVQKARKAAATAGIKVVIDPRHSIAGAAYLAMGIDPETVAKLTYLAGLKDDHIATIEAGVREVTI